MVTSAATLEIARQASIVVQPSGASVDDLHPAVLTFHELVRAGVPVARLAFALCKIGTDAEEAEARAYIAQAGFHALAGFVPERPAYRQAQTRASQSLRRGSRSSIGARTNCCNQSWNA